MRPRTALALSHPVTVGGVRHDALNFRKPNGRDLRAVRGGFSGETGIKIAARLAGVSDAVIYALDEADAERVGATVHTLLDQVL